MRESEEFERSASDAAVVVPVNAETDIGAALQLLDDLGRYRGRYRLDLVFVVNNFAAGSPPPGLSAFEARGARVLAVPNARRPGVSVYISAKTHGLQASAAEHALLFDADCRIRDPSALIDWYVDTLRQGATAAYTRVGHHGLASDVTVRVRVWLHHTARWFKRAVLRIPTLRGSNYAVRRATFLRLVDEGRILDDIHVGPAIKGEGGRIAYSGRAELAVLTSGRYLRPGWARLVRYVPKRIRYNVRMLRNRE